MSRIATTCRGVCVILLGFILALVAQTKQNDNPRVAIFPPDALVFQDVAMVPLPALAELLDAEVAIDPASGSTIVTRLGKAFTCANGDTLAQANGIEFQLPLAPLKKGDVLYVPLLPLIAAFGGTTEITPDAVKLSLPGSLYSLTLPVKKMDVSLAKFDPTFASELFIIDIDGKEIRRLTYSLHDDGLPILSPEGTLLLYADYTGLYLRPAVSPVATRLMSNEKDAAATYWGADPCISPDGATIAFSRWPKNDRNKTELMLVGLDGRGMRSLGGGRQPAFSPDGTLLAYTVDQTEANATIMLYNMATRAKTKLGVGSRPVFSPDGNWLLWTGPCKTSVPDKKLPHIITYALAGEHAGTAYYPRSEDIEYDSGDSRSAAFTPDSRRIVYWQDGPGFWIADVDRTTATKLVVDDITRPTFTRDGNNIIGIRIGTLIRMKADGTGITPLTRGLSVENYTLLPDGKHIILQASGMGGAEGTGQVVFK